MNEFFKKEELDCPCCGQYKMDPVLMAQLNALREKYGAPLIINSGYRCDKHNAEVGGKIHSYHLQGMAVDIATFRMTNEMKSKFMKLTHEYFKGIGIAKSFVHLDVREDLALWVY